MCASRTATTRGHTAALRDRKVHVVLIIDRREHPVRTQQHVGRVACTQRVLRLGLWTGCDSRIRTVIPVCVVAGTTATELAEHTNIQFLLVHITCTASCARCGIMTGTAPWPPRWRPSSKENNITQSVKSALQHRN